MAIGFARATPIQRSRGHSTIQRLAYTSRTRLVDARTGIVFDHSAPQDLVATSTLLPPDVAELDDDASLWQAIEKATKLTNAALGFELLMSLPMPSQLPVETSVAMAREFVQTVIVNKHLLPATVSVHAPHGPLDNEQSALEVFGSEGADGFDLALAAGQANLHAHVLVSPRQLTRLGLSIRRYTRLDATNRGGQATGRNWGRLWYYFQNAYLASVKSDLRVTPNPPVPLQAMPLKDVRRWRRRLRSTASKIDGRSLLVNAERELENRRLVETIDGAMECFDAPFTRGELETFYRRHLSPEVAVELTSATIGLGECVELAMPGSKAEWYAGVHLVQHELAAFGRALVLGERRRIPRDLSAFLDQGFTLETRDLLTDIFNGPDLTIVKTQGSAELLAADLARIGERAGYVPVTIANAAGHRAPHSVVRKIDSLQQRMVSDAIVILDDVDCLKPAELSLVLAIGLAGNSHVVLLERQDSEWPKLELLELLEQHAQLLHWNPSPAPTATGPAEILSLPRSAITRPLLGRPCQVQAGWPTFGVDPFGAVVTSPKSIASVIALLVTAPYEPGWTFSEHDREADQLALSLRLAPWVGNDDPNTYIPSDDELFLEEAALAALDLQENDYDFADAAEPDLNGLHTEELGIDPEDGSNWDAAPEPDDHEPD